VNVSVKVTDVPEGTEEADVLLVTDISAELAAEAGTAAMRDAARAGAETTASPFLNTRERRNIADLRSATWGLTPSSLYLRVVVVVWARWPT
jgi:hypothetical protein